MPNLTPRHFPELSQCDAVSATAMQSHVRLYEGYVEKYNQLAEKLATMRARGLSSVGAGPDFESVKADMTFALSAIKNHELFFDGLVPAKVDEPTGALAQGIVKFFNSVPQYLVDLKQTAVTARGWAWTAYDLDQKILVNYGAGAQDSIPVWNSIPILGIDLYGHAYFYDFGNNKLAYVEAIMKAINWEKVSARYDAVVGA